MKQVNAKLQYILTKRNGRCYKVFLNDLKNIQIIKQRQKPKVPDFNTTEKTVQLQVAVNPAPMVVPASC
jgi:hypothetical protein